MTKPARFLSGIFVTDTGLQVRGRTLWELTEALEYYSAILGRTLIVPVGFRTDIASVPWFVWSFVPPTGRYSRPAVVHDYLYRAGNVSRAQADAVFCEAMLVEGVVWWRRWVVWAAVRLFGWAARGVR